MADGFELSDLIDMHVHTGPDIQPRFQDDIDAARSARDAEMKAILLKSHITLTADRAVLAEKQVPGIRVFGSLVLNSTVGGINPQAVEVALKMGAKEIWFPTFDAANHHGPEGRGRGYSILTEMGKLHNDVFRIIELIASSEAILGTGHISVNETLHLVEACRDIGLRKILVTHPEAAVIRMPVDVQKEIRGEDLYFERCFVDTTYVEGHATNMEELAYVIGEVGEESTVLTTDFGLKTLGSPVEAMREYLSGLLDQGLSEVDVRLMAGGNPSKLLGLS